MRPEQNTPVISVENVSAGFPGQALLENISFTVSAGEIFVILGPSGCGKSTLLKTLIGLLPPLAGKIFINGNDIVSAKPQQRENILSSAGVTFQNNALFGSMTILENVMLPLEELTELPESACRQTAAMKLQLVGLTGFEHYLPAQLSGGMQKRAALARAMVLEPKILFLDEPSAGLDPTTSAQLDKLIHSLAGSNNIAFVIVTHELESVFALAERVIMLDKNARGIIAAGKPEQLQNDTANPAVWRFFNRKTETDPIPTTPSPAAGYKTQEQL